MDRRQELTLTEREILARAATHKAWVAAMNRERGLALAEPMRFIVATVIASTEQSLTVELQTATVRPKFCPVRFMPFDMDRRMPWERAIR